MEDGAITDGIGPFGSAAQTRALAAWSTAAVGRAMPRLDDHRGDPGELASLPQAGEALLPSDGIPAALARWLRATGATMNGPARFRAVGGDGAGAWSGTVLPYADGAGRVAAVEVIVDHHAEPTAEDMDRLSDVAALSFAPAIGRVTAVNPWRPRSDAALPPADAADRRAEARTWTALAVANPACRRNALQRALQALEQFGEEAVAELTAWLTADTAPGASLARDVLAGLVAGTANADEPDVQRADRIDVRPLARYRKAPIRVADTAGAMLAA